MRKLAIFVLFAVMLLSAAAPAFATETHPDCTCMECEPWCGKVRTQGYWKNDGISSNDTFMGWSFGTPSGGDYKQIFANQAIAWHNNYVKNPVCECVPFQETYYKGSCGKLISMYEIDEKVHYAFEHIDTMSRDDLLKLKDVLDAINNGYNIYACHAES